MIAAAEPLAALGALRRPGGESWQRSGTRIFAITGSTGKTSTKDILAALLRRAGLETVQTPGNWNTEIGLPLVVLGASEGTRRTGARAGDARQPARSRELTRIADPDVGMIVNIGPAHIELLGSLEAIAAAKAELIAGLRRAPRPSSRPASRCSSRTCAATCARSRSATLATCASTSRR